MMSMRVCASFDGGMHMAWGSWASMAETARAGRYCASEMATVMFFMGCSDWFVWGTGCARFLIKIVRF